jgi:putative two-component system response regulator
MHSSAAAVRITRAFSSASLPAVRNILVVDDEENLRNAMSKFLRSRGFDVSSAEGGAQALELLQQSAFDGMLCDVRMPEMSGLEVMPRALEISPDLAILMLTAVNDAPTATEALLLGAVDYLMKPIELADLEQVIQRALHKRELGIEQRKVDAMIREEVAQRTMELERERAALRQLTVAVVDSLIVAQEAKDSFMRGHAHRVADLSASIAEYLGLDPDVVEKVRLAGRLHDVGRIGLREEVLHKPGPLTDDEFQHVKEHVRIGVEVLAPLEHLGVAIDFIQDHHEHWDGGGYPRGLAGENIAIGGRILAAADAFDALTTRRPYRGSVPPVEAVQYLAAHVGTLLDPRVYDALSAVVSRRKSLVFIDDMQM